MVLIKKSVYVTIIRSLLLNWISSCFFIPLYSLMWVVLFKTGYIAVGLIFTLPILPKPHLSLIRSDLDSLSSSFSL